MLFVFCKLLLCPLCSRTIDVLTNERLSFGPTKAVCTFLGVLWQFMFSKASLGHMLATYATKIP